MAEENEDPREVPWHPRFAPMVLGHQKAQEHFSKSLQRGKLHHAWLINGPKGIGKATLAYKFAAEVLGVKNFTQTLRWIMARSHPDLFVLERQLGETKPRKLKTEISVDDARQLSDFFSRTSSGGWRVGIVDAADDLNTESANALLKLVEEPPANCLLMLVNHNPGRLLRTMKSRCTRLHLETLSQHETTEVVVRLSLEPTPQKEDLQTAARLSSGSPGRALSLLTSEGAKAFETFSNVRDYSPATIIAISNRFSGRASNVDEFNIFIELLLNWVAIKATEGINAALAAAHAKIAEKVRTTNAYNLDRRQAVVDAITLIKDALKLA